MGPPTIFTKAITAINAPYGDVPINPAVSTKIDWEVELGVVIGRAGSNIKRADALDHVFGYTVVNDVTARDIQNGWGGQWFKGKSLDGSCPVGPWVVTTDEVPDVQSLDVQLRVNGVVKQDANTRDMIYPVDAIIEWLSVGMTLLPGMLIATGHAGGRRLRAHAAGVPARRRRHGDRGAGSGPAAQHHRRASVRSSPVGQNTPAVPAGAGARRRSRASPRAGGDHRARGAGPARPAGSVAAPDPGGSAAGRARR